MNFLIVMILAVALVALAFAGFAISMLVKKGGRFPDTHISSNRYLKSQGISCAQTYDRIEQSKARKQIRFSQLNITPDSGRSKEE